MEEIQISCAHTACVTQVRAHTHCNETVISIFYFFKALCPPRPNQIPAWKVTRSALYVLQICTSLETDGLLTIPLEVSWEVSFFLPIISLSVTTRGYFELTFQKAKLKYFFSSVSLKNHVAFGHLKPILYASSYQSMQLLDCHRTQDVPAKTTCYFFTI